MVWEETIILLPDNVHYVFLSATIPNAKQFAEWICHLHKQVCCEPAVGDYSQSVEQMYNLSQNMDMNSFADHWLIKRFFFFFFFFQIHQKSIL